MTNEELIEEARWLVAQFPDDDVEVSGTWLLWLADALEAAAVDLETKSVVHDCCLQVVDARRVLNARDSTSLAFAKLHRILDEKQIGESL